jgi:3-hydroxyisobutyrate dehydrogenase
MKNNIKPGFVGLGNMGGAMAMSLAKAGMTPKVHDLRVEAMDGIALHGGVPASLIDLIDQCDVIGTCLLYDEQVQQLFLGPDGIVTRGRAGQVAMIHSTVLPATVRRIAEAAAAKGMGLIDAPVSGGGERLREGALEGTLTLMVGCEDWAFTEAEPVLRVMGSEVIRVGGPGAGQVVKLGNNIMALCNQVLHMEAIRFVEAFGVNREALARVAGVSSGASWAVSNYDHFDRYAVEHTLAGSPELPHRLGKDLRYVIEVAQAQWTYLPTVALCAQLLPELFEKRWAENAKPTKE